MSDLDDGSIEELVGDAIDDELKEMLRDDFRPYVRAVDVHAVLFDRAHDRNDPIKKEDLPSVDRIEAYVSRNADRLEVGKYRSGRVDLCFVLESDDVPDLLEPAEE